MKRSGRSPDLTWNCQEILQAALVGASFGPLHRVKNPKKQSITKHGSLVASITAELRNQALATRLLPAG
jgi:hypothetical protein